MLINNIYIINIKNMNLKVGLKLSGARSMGQGDRRPENGDRKMETGERRPENGDRKTENGKWKKKE